MMSSVAHSVVLVKCPDSSTANRVAFEMAKNCNPAKWICVTADVVKAVSGSNIAMLLMTTEDGGMAETILKNFEKQFGIDNVYESKEASSDKWENPYSDVKDNDWFFDTVKFASENGIMNGVDNDKFAPGETLTRAMLVTILYRVDGSPEIEGTSKFEDVKGDEWYGNAVIWANQNGIVNGISDTQFAPSHPIKREQAAAIIYRYAKAKEFDVSVGENTNILSYDDAFDIPEYAVEAFQYVVGAGIITGRTESTLAGAASLTRAEAATIISRFINYNA